MITMKSHTINFPTLLSNKLCKHKAVKKFFEYVLTLLCIITLNFFLPRLIPGDPFTFLSGEIDEVTMSCTEEQLARYKAYFGLDKPLPEQYADYLVNLLHGDIGYSMYYNEAVLVLLGRRAAWTISLVAVSLLLSCILGILLGSISAWNRNNGIDQLLYFLMISFSEIPAFLTGLVVLLAGAVWLDWFPLSGGMSPFMAFATPVHKALDLLQHAVLPVITLVLARLSSFYMISRSSMLTVLSKDYMRTARGKGLSQVRILFVHALRNAAIPVITRIFLNLGTAFSGAVLVENVFNYPGVGQLMRESVMLRDYVLIQGIFLFFAVSVLTMNFIADVLYKKLDPRVT